jgi:hypothetical protein
MTSASGEAYLADGVRLVWVVVLAAQVTVPNTVQPANHIHQAPSPAENSSRF